MYHKTRGKVANILRFFILFMCGASFVNVAFSAQLVGNEITLCTNGYSPDNSTCTTYTDGDCGSGYYDLTSSNTTFLAPSNNLCTYSGYKLRTLPETTITLAYHGTVIGNEITLCNNGYSPDNSTCTSYSQTEYCPENYYGIDTTLTAYNGSCATGYSRYIAEDSCGYDMHSDTCVSFCTNDLLTTNVGTCASLCTLGISQIVTSNGVVVPLWSTKQTTPSINVEYNDEVCYGNLTDEPTTEKQIYVQWDTTTLHTTK